MIFAKVSIYDIREQCRKDFKNVFGLEINDFVNLRLGFNEYKFLELYNLLNCTGQEITKFLEKRFGKESTKIITKLIGG